MSHLVAHSFVIFLVISNFLLVKSSCGIDYKPLSNGSCALLENSDVLRAMHFLAFPPKSQACDNITTVQDTAVCEDNILPVSPQNGKQEECVVWSVISSDRCDHYGSLEFEIYWSHRGCKVTLYHTHVYTKGNVCNTPAGIMKDHPNIFIVRDNMWGGQCFNCIYKKLQKDLIGTPKIDILKIQNRAGVKEDFDGVQYTVLADMYLHIPQIADKANQVVFTTSVAADTLVDLLGRESEHAWNMWAAHKLLAKFFSFAGWTENGPWRLQPTQFSHMLQQVGLDPTISYYHNSLLRIKDKDSAAQVENEAAFEEWVPQPPPYVLHGKPPSYCPVPSKEEDDKLQAWISGEMKVRCHATRLAVPCERKRQIDAFIPCASELMDTLAEDYAAMKGWCDFSLPEADIVPLTKVDKSAAKAFNLPPIGMVHENDDKKESAQMKSVGISHTSSQLNSLLTTEIEGHVNGPIVSKNTNSFSQADATGIHTSTKTSSTEDTPRPQVRLAFFFTVYHDEAFVNRLFSRLYSPHHYYLFHIDAAGSKREFEKQMRLLAGKYTNVHCAKDVQIVYGASTATILLTRAMAWFDKYTSGWDYFVPITGSDYPLVPLHRMEKILAYQSPPMPFVMAWTPGTSTHVFRLQKTHPVFEQDPYLVQSVKATESERGKPLGAVISEMRSNNFGPPLFCDGKSSFYHLDSRQNKSGRIFDSMWLFPRDNWPDRGNAYVDFDPQYSIPSFDNGWRLWKKSDPGTTGAYDRESINYIVNSLEGKKYWHYFKHMLLGSEEHYYVSLLYNWNRTQSFVQTLSAQTVWNTWKVGLWESNAGFQTHTHFLSMNEWDILKGFAMRGMFFGRKFSTKKTGSLLDKIDSYILLNESTDAGLYWPGFFDVDITSVGKVWIAEYRRKVREGLIAGGLPKRKKKKKTTRGS